MRYRENVVWACREVGQYPNANVRSAADGDVIVSVEPGDGKAYGLRVPRRVARLLARRLNQCLDQRRKHARQVP